VTPIIVVPHTSCNIFAGAIIRFTISWRPNMHVQDLLTIVGMLALIAFIVFAFWQGMGVKPSGNTDRSTIAGETDISSSGGGHGGDGGGH
jgi:hypothetical protein